MEVITGWRNHGFCGVKRTWDVLCRAKSKGVWLSFILYDNFMEFVFKLQSLVVIASCLESPWCHFTPKANVGLQHELRNVCEVTFKDGTNHC